MKKNKTTDLFVSFFRVDESNSFGHGNAWFKDQKSLSNMEETQALEERLRRQSGAKYATSTFTIQNWKVIT